MTWFLVCQLSPKVTFVFACRTRHHLPGTAVPGAAIAGSSGRRQRRGSYLLKLQKMHLRDGLLLQTAL